MMNPILGKSQTILASISNTFGTSSEICKLIKLRGAKRANLTRTVNSICPESCSEENQINFYLAKLTELKICINDYDDKISSLIVDGDVLDDDKFSVVSEACDFYMDQIDKSICNLSIWLRNLNSNDIINGVQSNGNSNGTRIKLPNIELPEFDGKPEEYEAFISSLCEILNKFNFSQYEKYTYLAKQVSGPAKQVVSSVPKSGDCFDAACDLLEKAFSSVSLQQISVIKRLIQSRLNFETRFCWMSEARSVIDQISRLQINSDTFIQYFLWQGMDESFKKHYMNVTNKSQPDLKDITDNMFEVFRRVEASRKIEISSNSNSFTLATNVDKISYNFRKGCLLCQSDQTKDALLHRMEECKKYPNAEAKISKIKELSGCFKCGFINHMGKNCKYKFNKKCKYCSKDHFDFLCLSKMKVSKESPNANEKNGGKSFQKVDTTGNSSTSHLISYSVMHNTSHKIPTEVFNNSVLNNTSNNETLLPTVSIRVNGNKICQRMLLDTASQLSFISESSLNKSNFKILDSNYVVKVNGFNNSRIFHTKLVELDILLGQYSRKITAVVVPEINTEIDAQKLKCVINGFKAANIELADKFLRHDSGKIDILLGTDNIHVLPIQSCVVCTENHVSVFYYCCAGVVLVGNVENLIKNLSKLPSLKDFISKISSLF